jgi:hypothetical protein
MTGIALALLAALVAAVVWLQRRGPFLQYLYFARFPLFLALALLLLPPVALYLVPSALANLFDLQPNGLVIVAWIAPLAAWVVMVTLGVILAYAPNRFGVPPVRVAGWLHRFRVPLFALLAAVLLGTCVRLSESTLLVRLLHLGIGLALAFASLLAATALQVRLSDVTTAQPALLLPVEWKIFRGLWRQQARARTGMLDRVVADLVAHAPPQPPLPLPAAAPPAGRPPPAAPAAAPDATGAAGGGRSDGEPGRGYLDLTHRRVRLGHRLATSFFIVTLVVYLSAFLFFWTSRFTLPALGYLLLLMMLAGWGLPGISFYLDRFRVPTLTLLAVFALLANALGNIDHYFPIVPLARPPAAAAADGRAGVAPRAGASGRARAAARAGASGRAGASDPSGSGEAGRPGAAAGALRQLAPPAAFSAAEGARPQPVHPIVVVAASGGGIAASLWTAHVLAGLQTGVGHDFTRSIRLVSAVSGGSVGTMYFLDRFTRAGLPPDAELPAIERAAGASSLDEVAWGVAYPDLWRGLLGVVVRPRTFDRGWALEQALSRRLAHPGMMLSQWRTAMAQGWMPATVLNATAVEDGRQFLLTGLDLPTRDPSWRFFSTYPGWDVAVVTAARLSATFPWVTPVSRALRLHGRPARTGLHLADGGYYDNFGVVTVVNWLRSLLPAYRDELRRRGVLVVLISALPDETDRQPLPPEAHKGWLYSLAGPIITLLHVRTSSQAFHNSLELALMTDLWKSEQIPIVAVPFVLRQRSPLSWKLTSNERRRVLDGWNEPENQRALAEVRRAFGVAAAAHR